MANTFKNFQKFLLKLTHSAKCCPHIETSQLICCANQLTGFYMRATLAFNGLKEYKSEIIIELILEPC